MNKKNKIIIFSIFILVLLFILLKLNYNLIYLSKNFNIPKENKLYITIDWEKYFLYSNLENAKQKLWEINNVTLGYWTKLSLRQKKVFNEVKLISINKYFSSYDGLLEELNNNFWKPTLVIPNNYIWISWTDVLRLSYNEEIILSLYDLRQEHQEKSFWKDIYKNIICYSWINCILNSYFILEKK